MGDTLVVEDITIQRFNKFDSEGRPFGRPRPPLLPAPRARATAAFDRFLELAPDDPRASMIRSLRGEAESAP